MTSGDQDKLVPQAQLSALEVKDPTGRLVVRPCIEVVLYSSSSRATCLSELSDARLALFADSTPALRWYKTNDMTEAKKVRGAPGRMLDTVFGPTNVDAGRLYGVEMHAGAGADDYALPSIFFLSEELKSSKGGLISRHVMRCCYPPELMSTVADMARTCTDHLATVSGHAGWSQYWNVGDPTVESMVRARLRAWLLRFPGLGFGDPFKLRPFIGKGQLAVGWLTWVDASARTHPKVRAPLAKPAIKALSIGGTDERHSLLLQAGDAAVLGDVNRNEWPDAYSTVGRAVAPLRIPDNWLEQLFLPGFESEEAVSWYLRFFARRETGQ